MKTILPICLLCGLLLAVAGVPGASIAPAAVAQDPVADERVVVELASGRTLNAVLDPKTDEQLLWLRWERGTAMLRRPIRWDRVVRAEVGGENVSGGQSHIQEVVAPLSFTTDCGPQQSTGNRIPDNGN